LYIQAKLGQSPTHRLGAHLVAARHEERKGVFLRGHRRSVALLHRSREVGDAAAVDAAGALHGGHRHGAVGKGRGRARRHEAHDARSLREHVPPGGLDRDAVEKKRDQAL